MEEQSADRNSFAMTYSIKTQQIDSKETDHYRVSQNKQRLLENFKQSMLEELPEKTEDYQIELLQNVKDSTPCFPIKEQSCQQSQNKVNIPSNKDQKMARSSQNQRTHKNRNHLQVEHNTLPLKSRNNLDLPPLDPLEIVQVQCQKQQLQLKLNQAMKFLCKGMEVDKYCFNKQKVEKIILYFSQDFEFMGLYLCQKRQHKIYSLSQFVSISRGLKTNNFQKYLQQGYKINEQKSFSIIFKERSFDFLSEDHRTRNKFIDYIQLLNQCS